MIVNRKSKDTVFTRLFGEKKYAFQLYKVFHPEDTVSTEDQIKIITIDNIFTNGEHNDLGLLMNNHLLLFVEAQSSWNGNMAIRTLLYVAETYKRYVLNNELDIMGKMAVTIPYPEIYVIFTGDRKDRPAELKLSEHFEKDEKFFKCGTNSLELNVKMIYDSDKGDIVYQYINFCKVFNAQMAIHRDDKTKAIKETLRICMNKSLLDEFIKKHKGEVYDIMSDFLFNEELLMDIHIKSEKRIARAEGLAEGREEGLAEGHKVGLAEGHKVGLAEGLEEGHKEAKIETAKNALLMGLSIEQISTLTGLSKDDISKLADNA